MSSFWAIKHKPSGKLLPSPRGRGGRGGTFVEINDPGTPRLFHDAKSAKAALRFWLAGEIHVGQHQDYSGDWDEDWRTVPKPDRKAEDMQVVRVAIIETLE